MISAFLVFIVTVLIYIPALQNGFVNWDDNLNVYDNPYIRALDLNLLQYMNSFKDTMWIPLTRLSHALNYAVWGLDPMGHHLTNILLHGLNAFLVVLIAVRLIPGPYSSEDAAAFTKRALIAAVVTGLLFGIHPLRVESVAWVTERKDVLSGFFVLLSLLFYLNFSTANSMKKVWNCYALSLVFFFMALMCKPMVVTFPAVLVILDIYPLRRFNASKLRVIAEKVPFFLLSIVLSVITIISYEQEGIVVTKSDVALIDRLLVAVQSLSMYLYRMIWPVNLAPLYPYPSEISMKAPEFALPIVLITGITAFSIYTWKRQRAWLAVWIYFVVTLLPVLGIIKFGLFATADRYTYLPSLGPTLLAGWGVSWLWKKGAFAEYKKALKKTAVIVSLLLVVSTLSFLSIKQIGIWKDSMTLWNAELGLYSSYVAHNNRGVEYLRLERYQDAMDDIDKSIELSPSYAEAHYNRGRIHLKLKEYQRAIADLDRAIGLNPLLVEAYYNRGTVYLRLAQYMAAAADFSRAIELEPAYAAAYNNRGDAFFRAGKHKEAIADLSKAVELAPADARAYYNRGTMQLKLGNYKESVADYTSAVELDEEYAPAYNNRGTIYFRLKRYSEAIPDFSRAIELDPKNVSAYKYRGICYGETGDVQRSNMDFRAAARLGDKGAQAYLGSIGVGY